MRQDVSECDGRRQLPWPPMVNVDVTRRWAKGREQTMVAFSEALMQFVPHHAAEIVVVLP